MTSTEFRVGAFFVLAVMVGAACSGGSDFSFFSRPDNPGDETTPSTPPHDPFEIPSGPAPQAVTTVGPGGGSPASSSTGVGGACDSCNAVLTNMASSVDTLCPNSALLWSSLQSCMCSFCDMGVGGGPGTECATECLDPIPFGSGCTSCAVSNCSTDYNECFMDMGGS